MPAKRKATLRYYSKRYQIGYVEEINGILHTRIGDERKTTKLRAFPENEASAIDILDERIFTFLYPEHTKNSEEAILHPFNTVWELIKDYKRAKFRDLKSDNVRVMFRRAVNYYFSKNVSLEYSVLFDYLTTINNNSTLDTETRRKYLFQLRRLFDFAVEHKAIDRNPIRIIGIPTKKKKTDDEKVYITPEQLDSLITYFKTLTDCRLQRSEAIEKFSSNMLEYALAYEFLYHTAMRVGEMLKLEWTRDIKENKILIQGKGGYKREFPLKAFPEVQRILKEMENFKPANGEKVFRWNNPAQLEYHFRKAKTEAIGTEDKYRVGVKPTLPEKAVVHSLRASGEWRMENILFLPYDVVSDIAGHSGKTRENHYRKIRTAEEIEKAIQMRGLNNVSLT